MKKFNKTTFVASMSTAQVISFDLFDTLVCRHVMRPVDIFSIVERRVGINHFASIRQQVETELRMSKGPHNDVKLSEIYDHMSLPKTKELMKIEIDIEKSMIFANDHAKQYYDMAVALRKRVIVTTDTYFPESFIHDILKRSGYRAHEQTFISSEWNKSKSSGDLFNVLTTHLNISGENILHIGDNLESDYRRAEEHGIASLCYETPRITSVRRPKRIPPASDFGDSIIQSVLFKEPCIPSACKNSFWHQLGYEVFGPIFAAYAAWLLNKAKTDEIEKLYFLSRDGFFLKKCYDLLGSSCVGSVPSSYLYASRKAFNLPSISSIDDDALRFLLSGRNRLTVAEYLARANLDPVVLKATIAKAGFHSPSQLVRSSEVSRMRTLLVYLSDELLRETERSRAMFTKYLAQEGLLSAKNIGIVDAGWHCSLQKSLDKILRRQGNSIKVFGYYVGTFGDSAHSNYSGSARGFLFQEGEPASLANTIAKCVELVEFVCSAPHGTVTGFKNSSQDIVVPVFDKIPSDEGQIKLASAVQEGILSYIEIVAPIWRAAGWPTFSARISGEPLERLLMHPTAEEARLLGDLNHSEGFGASGHVSHIAKPEGTWSSRILGMRNALWRRGYLTRLFYDGVRFGDNQQLEKTGQ